MAKKTLASHKLEFLLTGKNLTTKAFASVQNSIKSLSSAAVLVGKTLALGFGGVGAAVVGLVRNFAPFETALVDLAKVSDAPLEQLKQKLFDIDPALGDLTTLTEGLYQTMSAGVTDPIKAFELLETAAKGAQAGHVALGDTVKALTGVMDGFKGEIRDAADASDFLFKIEQLGKVSFEELVPVMAGAAATAQNLGISVEELGGVISQVSLTAPSTAMAITQVESAMNTLSGTSEILDKAYKDLNVTSGQALIKQKGFVGAMQALRSWADKAGVSLKTLTGVKEAMKAVLATTGAALASTNDKIRQMANRAGKTEEAFKKWSKTLSGLWDTFKNTLGLIAKRIVNAIAPDIEAAMDAINDALLNNADAIVGFFTDVFDAIRDVLPSLDDMKAGIKTAIDWLVKFDEKNEETGKSLKDELMENLKLAGGFVLDLGNSFLDMLPSLKRIIQELSIFSGWIKEIALKDGPIFIGWMNGVVFKEGDLFLKWLIDTKGGLKDFDLNLLKIMTTGNHFVNMSVTMMQALKGFAQGFAAVASAALDTARELEKWGSQLYDDAIDWGAGLIDGFITGIKSMKDKAVIAVKDIMKELRKLFPSSPAEEGPFKDLNDTGPGLVSTFAKGIAASSSMAVSAVTDMMSATEKALKTGLAIGITIPQELSENIHTSITLDIEKAMQNITIYLAEVAKIPELVTTVLKFTFEARLTDVRSYIALIDSIPTVVEKRFMIRDAGEALSIIRRIAHEIRMIPREIRPRIAFSVGDAFTTLSALETRLLNFKKVWVKELKLNVDDAINGLMNVINLMDSIPDEVIKKVNIQYYLQASPKLPFSEGYKKLVQRMNSLPTESEFTVRASGRGQLPSGGSPISQRREMRGGEIRISNTINVTANSDDPKAIAKQIDRELGVMTQSGRSHFARTLSAGFLGNQPVGGR